MSTDSEPLTILIVDDHQVVRDGLRVLLDDEPDFRVVGETGDGLEAIRLARELRPDVLILDLMIPGLHGLEVTREIGKHVPESRVLVLSMHHNEAYVVEALNNGAMGYVLKDSSSTDLVKALHEIAAGRRYLSPPFSDRAIGAYLERAEGVPKSSYDRLSPRERQVFQLVTEGCSNVEIGERLSISPRTVESHRSSIMQKLGLRSQADLFRFAIREGLLPLEG